MRLIFCFVFFVVFCTSYNSIVNEEKRGFIFNGNIEGIDSGTIVLLKVGREEFYNLAIANYSVPIKKGRFQFIGKLNYPHAFYALITTDKKAIHTEMFFLDKGLQSINVKIDSLTNNFLPIKGSLANDEYLKKFKPQFEQVENLYKKYMNEVKIAYEKYGKQTPETERESIQLSLKNYVNTLDNVIYKYIKRHPSSYVGLWRLLERFYVRGYKTLYDSSFSILTNTLKTTKTGRVLHDGLNESRTTSNGMIFPKFKFLNTENDSTEIPYTAKYTLIDFWFSNCGPCIAEFPGLLAIYEKHQAKGFEIIGISVDVKERRSNWIDAIKKNNLAWPQLWDCNGDVSKQLYINSYPTNFLLDSNGRVIKKNIKSIELNKLLESIK